jgi:hypothetical protein
MKKIYLTLLFIVLTLFIGCTQESQNQISRSLQNWTGINGIVEVYSGGKLVKRFFNVDKLTTASGTSRAGMRLYRYGFGYNDINLNGILDKNEKRAGKKYFDVSSYANVVYYEQ